MALIPALLLLGQSVLDAIWTFTWKMLLLAPIAIAGLVFMVWLMSAPSDEARWTERWIGRGVALSFVTWLANVFAVSLALWGWLDHRVAALPKGIHGAWRCIHSVGGGRTGPYRDVSRPCLGTRIYEAGL